ncbi:MAG: GreA/GreB family elongation factor [Flavobacterium sp.]|nr:GreA/GreB family elongation factor [Flavobacterium sp.]
MKYGGLIIEHKEYDKLIQFIGMGHHRRDETYQASVNKILDELKSAKKLSLDKMPEDVVRFNSVVEISFPNGNKRTLQIVSPNNGDVALNKISILAPMSLALFGYAADDEVMWQFPSGVQAIKILKVDQMTVEPKSA